MQALIKAHLWNTEAESLMGQPIAFQIMLSKRAVGIDFHQTVARHSQGGANPFRMYETICHISVSLSLALKAGISELSLTPPSAMLHIK